MNKMNIEIKTTSYNERRYGRPYIAVVDLADTKSTPQWGQWIGSPGDEGMLIIEAHPGDVIMRGQKDNRNPRNSAPNYYFLGSGGDLILMSKTDAFQAHCDFVAGVENIS